MRRERIALRPARQRLREWLARYSSFVGSLNVGPLHPVA
jgi:predicted RNA-binding protein with PIN domain